MTDPLPDAIASDPAMLGWMQGFPPPPERQVLWRNTDHWRFPKTRWAFSHYRELLPTVRVAGGHAAPLPRAIDETLGALPFTPLDRDTPITLDEGLLGTYADGVLVVHKGQVVFERWYGVTGPETRHIAFSVTKSFVGTIAAALIAEGRLDPAAPVADYVPELGTSGFGHASVRQVMDMTTAVDFSEEYTDPKSGIGAYSAAVGFVPPPADYQGPRDAWSFLTGIAANGDEIDQRTGAGAGVVAGDREDAARPGEYVVSVRGIAALLTTGHLVERSRGVAILASLEDVHLGANDRSVSPHHSALNGARMGLRSGSRRGDVGDRVKP